MVMNRINKILLFTVFSLLGAISSQGENAYTLVLLKPNVYRMISEPKPWDTIPVTECTEAKEKEALLADEEITDDTQRPVKPYSLWIIPLQLERNILFFKSLTEKGLPECKEGLRHPWLGRTCYLFLLKNGKRVGNILYVANYDCEPEHCWVYVCVPNTQTETNNPFGFLDLAQKYLGGQDRETTAYLWSFIKSLGISELGTKPFNTKGRRANAN